MYNISIKIKRKLGIIIINKNNGQVKYKIIKLNDKSEYF